MKVPRYCFLFNKRELHSFYEFTTTSLLGNIHTKVKQCQSLSIRLFQFTQSSNRVCLRPATLLLATGGFNPCTHTGCDNKESNYIYTRMTFQSTHPYRVRQDQRLNYRQVIWFQSTHPYRVRRLYHQRVTHLRQVSIHAPIQGATI